MADMLLFHEITMLTENNKNTEQVSAELDKLVLKLRGRANAIFIPLNIRNDLSKLAEESEKKERRNREWFIPHVQMFYQNCIDYILLRISHFSSVSCLKWTELNTIVKWTDIQTTLRLISNSIVQKLKKLI